MKNIDLTGRHLEITPELREYAIEKVSKLDRLLTNLDIHVTLAAEKHRQSCTIVAQGKGATYTAEATEDDLRKAINESVDLMARQMRKDKTAKLSKSREGADTIRKGDGAAV